MNTGIRMEHINKAFRLLDEAHHELSIKKAVDIKPLIKSKISKSITIANSSLNETKETLIKGFDDMKSMITSLQEKNKLIASRLDKLDNTSTGRKSLTNASNGERFQKSEDGLSDENTFNVNSVNDLNKLSDKLLEIHGKMIEKGNTDSASLIEGTINSIEINKSVPQFAYRPLHQLGIKLVTDNPLSYQNHLFQNRNNRSFSEIFNTVK